MVTMHKSTLSTYEGKLILEINQYNYCSMAKKFSVMIMVDELHVRPSVTRNNSKRFSRK